MPGVYSDFIQKFKQLLNPTYEEICAVNKISLSIAQVERVVFIGPNRAGKSTTIKMLSSVFCLTFGEIKALGLNPWQNRPSFLIV